MNDTYYMREALRLAEAAAQIGEVPVGAVIVKDGTIIASAYNTRETDKSALAHCEVKAIADACKILGGWRLVGCTLYVTLEPCPMCAGAVVNARIPRVVYGTGDSKNGAFGGMFDLLSVPVNHRPEIVSGVLGDECADILRRFFKERRDGGGVDVSKRWKDKQKQDK